LIGRHQIGFRQSDGNEISTPDVSVTSPRVQPGTIKFAGLRTFYPKLFHNRIHFGSTTMKKCRHRRIAAEEWQSQEATILRLYVEQRMPLTAPGGLIDIMRKQHDFSARFVIYHLCSSELEQRMYADA
jgi:hypothetical protein